MTHPDWDDDRLDAAFHARFDKTVPTGLAKEVHVRIAGTSPARFTLPRIGQPWSLAAAAVIVVLVGAAMYLPATSSLPAGTAGSSVVPTAATTTAPESPTPTEQVLPGSLFDGALPIVSVPEAIALRDAGTDDREIAVHGWLTSAPLISCGGEATKLFVSPVQLRCPDQLVWLTQEAESLIRTSGDQTETVTPTGPAINPDLDTMWVPAMPMPVAGGSTPIDVVLAGHFDDRRAALCPPAEHDACRDRFVVDSVAIVHGATTGFAPMRDITGTPISTDADIARIIASEAPDSPILSTVVVDGPGLATMEPSLATGQAGLIDQPVLWVVRVLESERVVTYIVVDGSNAIYEMNPAGEAILVGGTAPTPSASSGAVSWPPRGAPVVVLTSEVGAGGPPVRVAVVDQSGRLEKVAEKGAVDPSAMSFEGRFGAYAEPGTQGRVHLSWVGGICDSQITVTVSKDVDSISFDMGPQRDCDSVGVGRQLVLDFAGSVDVPAIDVVGN
ncbi:MAG: hypothetical protein ACJ769_02205 [Chloroflexota bacterium]